MKNKRIQRMLATLTLSVAVMTSLMASTVAAAETNEGTVSPMHMHIFVESEPKELYEYANSVYHYRYYGTIKTCFDCGYTEWNELGRFYEEHDMGGAAEPPHRYRCLQCDYEE